MAKVSIVQKRGLKVKTKQKQKIVSDAYSISWFIDLRAFQIYKNIQTKRGTTGPTAFPALLQFFSNIVERIMENVWRIHRRFKIASQKMWLQEGVLCDSLLSQCSKEMSHRLSILSVYG